MGKPTAGTAIRIRWSENRFLRKKSANGFEKVVSVPKNGYQIDGNMIYATEMNIENALFMYTGN